MSDCVGIFGFSGFDLLSTANMKVALHVSRTPNKIKPRQLELCVATMEQQG